MGKNLKNFTAIDFPTDAMNRECWHEYARGRVGSISGNLKLIARKLTANLFDYENKQKVKKTLNNELYALSKGFYSDQSWEGVDKIWKFLTKNDIDWAMTDAKYQHNEKGEPTSKRWTFEVYFIDKKDKKQTLYGVVIASGAGSVEDPLDRYDITAYVS